MSDRIYEAARVALQTCPAIGSMERANKVVEAIAEQLRSTSLEAKLRAALVDLLPHAEAELLGRGTVYPSALAKIANAQALIDATTAPQFPRPTLENKS